ncbi:MAG: fumarylacetoacetate hydrolase family protein [Burkholderiaceae bacterium]|nr:fumarylacetoacetate hydrolase family protein [Burkholderiaceae bacterium]
MKLATYKDGSRDGQLVVVSHDLSLAHYATGVATRLQQVLDDWNFLAPLLQDLSETLNHGKARHAFAFDPQMCMAPLPRAFGRADAPARAGEGDAGEIVMRPSDPLLGPCDDVFFPLGGLDASAVWPEFRAGLAVVVGDVEAGVTAAQALEGVRLLTLVNDWSLWSAGDEGAALCQPGGIGGWTSCAPVAVTLDELGGDWQRGRPAVRLEVRVDDRSWGCGETAADLPQDFGMLIAQLARQRPLRAGMLIGAGLVGAVQGLPVASWRARRAALRQASVLPAAGTGAAAPGARRARAAKATLAQPLPALAPLREGDRVRLELIGAHGSSLCGAIEQAWLPI